MCNRVLLIFLLLCVACSFALAEESYVEELVEELYMQENFKPMYAEGMILVDNHLNVREKPFIDSDVVGKLYYGDMVFITGSCNGYYEINTNRFVSEEYVLITENYSKSTVFVNENMKYLRIKYIGKITEKVAAEGVTMKSSLWFLGEIPVYDIVDGYVYFPRGKGIYRLPEDAFDEFIPVGEDSEILTAYRTTYSRSGSQESRAKNIALAASYLDGTVIQPGKIFSFNDTTGDRTRAKGYEMAAAYLGEEVIQAYGGGVCQISSTIYSAVRQCSGIEIVERKVHSMRVGYLPEELEATVNYPNRDFRFQNNYDFPVKLSVKVIENGNDGVLLVELRKGR